MTERLHAVDIRLDGDVMRGKDVPPALLVLWDDRVKPALDRGDVIKKLHCYVTGDVLSVEFITAPKDDA